MDRRTRKASIFMAFLLMILMVFGTVTAQLDGPGVSRIGGDDRYETAARVALEAYDSADMVILARGDDAGGFADGLSASVLAGALNIPILLTKPDALPAVTLETIEQLGAKMIYVLGGTGAISNAVLGELMDHGFFVKRLSGDSRFETAAKIAAEVGKATAAEHAFVVNGYCPADSLVAAPAAFKTNAVILQVSTDYIPGVTRDALGELGIKKIYIIGGTGVVSERVEDELRGLVDEVVRLGGSNRFETSVIVAEALFPGEPNMVFAGGLDENLVDSIGACIFGAPILYVQRDEIPSAVQEYLDENVTAESEIRIIGGEGAVSEEVTEEVEDVLQHIVSAVTLGGDAVVGETLTATAAPAGATVTYEWLRGDSADGSYVAIEGATSANYVLTETDAGKYIKVVVTGIDDYKGTVSSSAVGPVSYIAAVDYNAVWNESSGTWYIKVTVPGEDLDAATVKSISVIKEAGVELAEPRPLTPDTDKVMWFGVAGADGYLTLKADGEYAYEVVRQDGSKYIFNLDYVSADVEGVVGAFTADIDYNAVWNESRGTWYIKVTVPGEDLDAASVEEISVIKEAGVELAKPRPLTPDTDKVMWFGVAKANGELTFKDNGEYAYEVVRQDGSKYTFSFTYDPAAVMDVVVKATWNATGRTGFNTVAGTAYVFQEFEMLIDGERISLHEDNVKRITSNGNSLTPNTDHTLWFNVLAAAGKREFVVVANDDVTYNATLNWTEPARAIATAAGEPAYNETLKAAYQKYNVTGVDLVNFDAMYQVKPETGNISKLTASGDNCLWFKVGDDDVEWAQEEGDHIFLVKQGDTWTQFAVNYTVETIEANADYKAVWNDSRETWYIKVTVPGEDLDAASVKAISVIKEADEEPDNPEGLNPDTDKVMWFGVAKANGELTFKDNGEYAYEVVRRDGTRYIFNFTYDSSAVTGIVVEATWKATGRTGCNTVDGTAYVFQEYELLVDGKRISLHEDNVKSITSNGNPLTPNTDHTLWFNVLAAAGAREFVVVANDDVTYNATLNWTEPREVNAIAEGEPLYNNERGASYQKYNVPVGLVDFDAMYQIKPVSGEISELTASGDNCLWFKVGDDNVEWVQEEGGHIFLVKHDTIWTKFVVNYRLQTFEANKNYDAVWNESRETWYIEVTVPGENLDKDSIKAIYRIREAGVVLENPQLLTPDTDKVLWFGVAGADGDLSFKNDGEYAYEVVRQDGTRFIFSFLYYSNNVRFVVKNVEVAGNLAAGKTLTATPVPAQATVTYRWLICDSEDGTFEAIAGATAATYELTDADLGKYIGVEVTGISRYKGIATSAAVGPIITDGYTVKAGGTVLAVDPAVFLNAFLDSTCETSK